MPLTVVCLAESQSARAGIIQALRDGGIADAEGGALPAAAMGGPPAAPGPAPDGASGEAASAAAPGGVAGALRRLGIPAAEAARYEAQVRAGAAMLCLAAANHRTAYRIRTILRRAGAQDIATSPPDGILPPGGRAPSARAGEQPAPSPRAASGTASLPGA